MADHGRSCLIVPDDGRSWLGIDTICFFFSAYYAFIMIFTDILAGFTVNNRVLRLPAIVLLNTTFRPGNSGLLRFQAMRSNT